MKIKEIEVDVNWLKEKFVQFFPNTYTNDRDVAQKIISNLEGYVDFLEKKEERLIKLEDVLNTIEDSTIPNKEDFLLKFKELKNA